MSREKKIQPQVMAWSKLGPLFEQALTHKSYANEKKMLELHNEKLEFLGDAVLDLVLAALLMSKFPLDSEGALSKKRASLVNEQVLSEIARKLNLSDFIRVGQGELQNGALERPRILAACYEALVGAYFLEYGFENVKAWISGHFDEKIQEISFQVDFEKDFKTRLQVYSQEKYKMIPDYKLISEEGPSHQKSFKSEVCILDRKWFGEGGSKKSSEQAAAAAALMDLLQEKK